MDIHSFYHDPHGRARTSSVPPAGAERQPHQSPTARKSAELGSPNATTDPRVVPPVAWFSEPPARGEETPVKNTLLQVFANTGHHFEFVPFTEQQLEADPNLEALCRNNDDPWREARDETGMPLPWLRFQFGRREVDANEPGSRRQFRSGALLAIETNVGPVSRGWILEPEEPVPLAFQHGAFAGRTPYAFPDVTSQPENGQESRRLFLPLDPSAPMAPAAKLSGVWIPLDLRWLNPIGAVVDVDLIIDFGNTRSVALLLEHNRSAHGSLADICRPVRFISRQEEPELTPGQDLDSASLIDSWLVLQEPTFAGLEPIDGRAPAPASIPVEDLDWVEVEIGSWPFRKKTERANSRRTRMPHMFVEQSPALLGPPAADVLVNLNLTAGGNCFLSSPKRYLWDDQPVGDLGLAGAACWTMNVQSWHPNSRRVQAGESLEKLCGTVFRFLDQDGGDWSLDESGGAGAPNERPDPASRPPSRPDQPSYPRSDALTWAAIAVLEAAHRQILSSAGRPAGQPFVPARLSSVILTFPPGWTAPELAAYRRKWQKAIDIFSLTRFADPRLVNAGGERPTLSMDLDEAVAAQLPLVFDQIQRLGNRGENWIELVGRGQGTQARVRLLNLDIGGGTTDVTIVEYQDDRPGEGVDLSATVMYRDSYTTAGDTLVRRVIENVLLPMLGESLADDQREVMAALWRRQKGDDRARWNRITRQVFLPIVNGWLAAVGANRADLAASPHALGVNLGLIDEFNEICRQARLPRLIESSIPLLPRLDRLNECIRGNFADLFQSLAKIVDAFDCDLILVSGKPSELPEIRQLLERELPLLPQRIQFTKDTPIGGWYPLGKNGRIPDAKTVTVVGAALHQAIKRGLIGDGWRLRRYVSPYLLTRNFWGTMPRQQLTRFGTVLLAPNEDRKATRLQIGDRIGRRLLPGDVRPEPVYQLRWRDRSRYRTTRDPVNALLDVTLERVPPPQPESNVVEAAPQTEGLRISAVAGTWNGAAVGPDDLELSLCTMESELHWLDAGIFHVTWPSANTGAPS